MTGGTFLHGDSGLLSHSSSPRKLRGCSPASLLPPPWEFGEVAASRLTPPGGGGDLLKQRDLGKAFPLQLKAGVYPC